jgi:hypothetical protein
LIVPLVIGPRKPVAGNPLIQFQLIDSEPGFAVAEHSLLKATINCNRRGVPTPIGKLSY